MTPEPVGEVLLASFDRGEILKNATVTALLWLVAFGARWLVLRALRERQVEPQEQRKLLVATRNIVITAVLIGTATVWFDELKTFAFSLVAVAAAVVLATKELIMCAGGTFLRTTSRSFQIGDRVEVRGLRGDVIDTSLFTTTILEIGPGLIGHQLTGRSITIPNGILLTDACANESYMDAFVLHTFTVPVRADASWARAERALSEIATEESSRFRAEAEKHFAHLSAERGIEPPDVSPRILVQLHAPDTVHLIVRVAAPARLKGRIEQAIVHRFLETMFPLGTEPNAA